MKRNHILISALILAAAMPLMTPAQHMSDENRIAWTGEMRKYKHQWLTKELEMSTEQSHKFFDLYDEMEDELERIYRETRNLESRTLRNDKSSDTECEAAARAVFEQKRTRPRSSSNTSTNSRKYLRLNSYCASVAPNAHLCNT